jgi:hypothetical protein
MQCSLQINDDFFNGQQLQYHRQKIEEVYGRGSVLTPEELAQRFEIVGIIAPFAVLKDRLTDKMGSVQVWDRPRLYFDYQPD